MTRYAVWHSMSGRITICVVLFFALMSAYVLVGQARNFAEAEGVPPEEEVVSPSIPLPVLSTDTWGVFDVETGELIAGSNTDTEHPIASVTKLFTAYTVEASGRTHEEVTITWSDLSTEGRAGKLAYGETMTLHELLFPLLLESSNDAGEAIRRTLGNTFSDTLEAVAERSALSQTRIVDGTGLSAGNISTVADLARFYAFLGRTEPHLIDITRLKAYVTSDDTGLVNNSPLIEQQGYSGGKHGFTDEAGRTFVGTFVLPDGSRIGMVILRSADLRKDAALLYVYGEARTK